MTWWPWRTEHRASVQLSYTDAVLQRQHDLALGVGVGDPSKLAALEIAAGIWGRAFASSVMKPDVTALTPVLMGQVARHCIRQGRMVVAIHVSVASGLRLRPASGVDIQGGPDPDSWVYELTFQGPSSQETRRYPAASVLDFRWAVDPDRPWASVSPLGSASCTAGALAILEQRLAEELSSSVGSILPVPQDGGADDDADPLKDLKQDLRGLRGRMAIVETVRAGWGEGASAGPARDLVPHRVGASPPQSIGALREQLRADVLEACGIPGGLVSTRSDGTGRREDYRRLAHGNLIPQSRIWATEISQKLNVPPPVFDLSAMYASDQVGRVAAFSKLVQSGVSIADSASQAGILGNE